MPEKRPRGRPSKSPAEIDQERRRIAAIAGGLFQNEGVAGISMRRLAKEAGVTPRTLYAYFAAKRDILQHIWATFFVDLFDQIDEIAQSNRPARERLRAACLFYIDYWETHDDRYNLVFMADSVSQSDVGVFLDSSAIAERYAVFSHLLDGVADSDSDTGDLTRLNALVCALDGIAHNKVTKSYYDWGSSKDMLDTILAGLLPVEGRAA